MARHFGLEKLDPDTDANVEYARMVWTALGITAAFGIVVTIVVLAWLASMFLGW